MDEKPNSNAAHNPHIKSGDLMSHSFGEGYSDAVRGRWIRDRRGVRRKPTFAKAGNEEFIHENHPAYDKTQGSEVKEKEKARNQMEPQAN